MELRIVVVVRAESGKVHYTVNQVAGDCVKKGDIGKLLESVGKVLTLNYK